MNKIYKVVWSKAKHCYIVTSELAKRNTKGCGARSLRMAAVSLGVAAMLIGNVGFATPVAEAGQHFTISNYRYTSSFLSWQPDTKSVTVTASTNDSFNRSVTTESDGSLQRYVIGNVAYEKNGIPRTNVLVRDYRSAYQIPSFMEDGESVRENAGKVATEYQEKIDGYAAKGADVSGYTVTLDMSDRGDVSSAYGGYSQNGYASNNTINVKSGTMDYLTGGYSNVKDANGNTVNVSGGTVKQSLMGGRSWGAGNTNSNTVTISNGSVRIVYGGWADGNDANANGNRVTISNGTSECVIGGFAANETNQNIVTISGGTIASSYEDAAVIGARNYGAHDATNDDTSVANKNEVTISGTAKVTGDVFGAMDYGYGAVATTENKVTIDGSASVTGAVMGGASYSRDQTNNKVYVKNGTVTGNVYGGRLDNTYETAATGNANANRVEVSGGTVNGKAVGGAVNGNVTGNATENSVAVNGGTVTDTIFGGNSDAGTVTGNTVTVNKGTVNTIYGGYSNSGTVTGNTVTVSNATLNGAVIGGTNGDGDANGNTVSIAGGTIGGAVWGGYSRNGDAKNNTVTVTDMAAGRAIYGGYAGNLAKNATGNTVKIKNVTAPANYHNLQGGYTDYTAEPTGDFVTGNTLIINGSNKFGGAISNFETIKLADDFVWKDGATVLQGNFAVNYNKTRPVLDITDAETALSSATSGSMTLLASSSANDFSTLSLKYSGGTATLDSANVSKDVKSGEGASSVANGVTITSATIHTVSLDKDNSYKNVLYKVQNGVSGISFAAMDWNAGRAAAAGDNFANVATVDATNLTFNDPEKASGSMALLSGATGIVSDMQVTAANHTQNFTNTLSNNVKLGATLEGTVTTLAGIVNYTVKDTTVKSVDLRNWNGRSSAVASGWKSVDGGLTVTAAGFTDPKLAAGQTYLDIVTTDTEGFFGSVTGDKAYQGSNLDLDAGNGVSLKGLQASGVKAEDSGKKLTYYASVKDVNSIEVSGWDGKKATAVDLTGWNLADGIAVDTDGMAAPSSMRAGDSETLVEATGANFTGIAVTGAYAWQNEGPLDTVSVNGVSVTGTSTGGGVKGDGTKIIYQKSKNAITSLTLGEVDFADKGTARSFGADDDLSSASINADGLSFTNASSLSDGQSMTLVDATGALGTATIANFTDKKYETKFTDKVTDNLTINGAQTDWLKQDGGTKLVYTVGDRVVSEAAVSGNLAWSDGVTHYTNTNYKFDGNTKVNVGVNFTATVDPLAGTTKTMTLLKDATGVAASNVTGTPSFTVTLDQANTTLSAGAAGTVGLSGNDVTYSVEGVELNKVTIKSVGDKADEVPDKWSLTSGATVETGSMTLPEVAAGESKPIITGSDGFFAKATINGNNAYETNVTEIKVSDKTNAVTIKGMQKQGVAKDDTNTSIVYKVGYKDISAITIGSLTWQDGGNLLDGSNEDYNYAKAAYDTDGFRLTNPEMAETNQSMTLLQANATLADMAAQTKSTDFSVTPVSGVTVTGMVTGNLAAADNKVTFTTTANQASELKFEKVEWTGDTPLIDHSKTLANVSFDGATVDTSNIDFYKEMYIEADQTTTLVSGFGGNPKDIKGTTYKVGTAFDGEGSATMENGNLVFRTKTSAGVSEQTHKAVMGVEATMGLLASGIGHLDKVLDGFGNLSNVGSDGASVAASFGGGKDRYETNSHVNINSWSAAVGVGARKETKKGTLQYGIFGEYGKGNYTMHSDVGRSDGDAHYAGGGLMAKWTNKHDVYTEASFRLGRVSDSANDLLRDGAGNAYGYDIHATYYGAHVGLGKIFNYKGGKSLDVYGKFFYTKRDGAEFDAKQHYNLDSVNSSVLRIGARYGTTDKKWNWYGGLAYEYEFDGEAKGTVNGTEIRAASIKGSSVRGEFGMRMDATKDNPWRTDISIYGYGGKHRGFGGSVNVAYTF